MLLRCGARTLDLGRPRVMGILNITPDSFSDGGELLNDGSPDLDRVVRRAERMRRAGAVLIDVGGESTRPGAEAVPEQQELDRVLPVVEAIGARVDVAISIDTSSPRLMREAAARGAAMINDVRALARPGALQAAAESGLAICLMHMQGELVEVSDFLARRAADCRAAGIGADRLVLDPGFGFGKTLAHNLALFAALDQIVEIGYPVLVGVSRKGMIGQVLGRGVRKRLPGGLALATLAAAAGVRLVRTHDVEATVDALAMTVAACDGWSGP
jgi:dihydropteroate synthase